MPEPGDSADSAESAAGAAPEEPAATPTSTPVTVAALALAHNLPLAIAAAYLLGHDTLGACRACCASKGRERGALRRALHVRGGVGGTRALRGCWRLGQRPRVGASGPACWL